MIQAPNPRAHATPQVGGAARFHFDGVPGPVTAHVDHADRESVTLRQPLPFLRLHGGVEDEQGRRAELTGVAVAVRDGTPSLVLELRYQRQREATVPFQTHGAAEPRHARRDPTKPYVYEPCELDTILDWNDEALRGDAPATPLTPLSIPTPKPAWHVVLWQRIKTFMMGLFG